MIPNAPPPVFHQLRPEYPELPTVPTTIQQLLTNLAQLDIRSITEKLDRLLVRLDTSLGQLNIADINSGLTNLLGTANHTLASPDITNSLLTLRRTLENAESLLKKVDGRVDPLVDAAATTLAAAQKTIAELHFSIRNLNGLLDADAPLRTDLTLTLEQLANAARAVADLAEFLERHPNALLTGRKPQKNTP
jgi:paraquat-inducible protein B